MNPDKNETGDVITWINHGDTKTQRKPAIKFVQAGFLCVFVSPWLIPVCRPEIRIFVERLAVLIEELHADLRPDQAFLHFLLYQLFHAALQVVRKILNDGEDFLNRRSLDDFLDE